MAQGVGIILHVTGATPPNDYAYTWKDDPLQDDVDVSVTGVTKSAAFNALGSLLLALPGALKRVEISGWSG